jgi:hypothetical protein
LLSKDETLLIEAVLNKVDAAHKSSDKATGASKRKSGYFGVGRAADSENADVRKSNSFSPSHWVASPHLFSIELGALSDVCNEVNRYKS